MQTPVQGQTTNQPKIWGSRTRVLLPLLSVVLVCASFSWLQWAGQQGITLGYPTPTVHIATLPSNIHSLQGVQLSASGTGRDLTYYWTINRDSDTTNYLSNNQLTPGSASGQSIHYSFPASGSYTIAVTVDDSLGHHSSDTQQVQILPVPPVASFSAQTDSFFSFSVSCDASSSQADPGTSIQTYTWDFGDGSRPESTSYSQDSHYYSQAGTYTIKLTVTDETGQQSQPVTQTVTFSSSSTS